VEGALAPNLSHRFSKPLGSHSIFGHSWTHAHERPLMLLPSMDTVCIFAYFKDDKDEGWILEAFALDALDTILSGQHA
jgi:hypothetical protein